MKTKNLRKQSGSTLMVVMSILATLMVIVAVAAEYTTTINRSVQRSNTLETAIALGDGCLDILFANWRTTSRTASHTAMPTSSFSSIPAPSAALFPNIPNFASSTADYYSNNTPNPPTVSNFKVVAVDAEWNPMASAATPPTPSVGLAQTGNMNTTSATYNYLASADITLPALRGNMVAKVRRIFQKQQLSPWNFAIFYVDPLEIHPGPLFTVTGWVHTNSDLYTAHSSLTFADKVTFGSDWYVAFKPGDLKHPNDVIASPNYPKGLPPARDQALQPFGLDASSIYNVNNANTTDGYRELIEPPTNATDPLSGERYFDQAGIVIQVTDNPNPNANGFDGVKGHDLVTIGTPNANGTITPLPSSNELYKMVSPAITTNQSIQDNREGVVGGIKIATLDISKMVTSNYGNPSYKSDANGTSFNGILYMYDPSATATNRRAVRLTGGSKLPTKGLSVASNNPVYIQGDFNTGATGATVPTNNPANLKPDGTYLDPANPPDPQVSGYTRAPASVLGDAVNILSSAWNDANSTQDLSTGLRNAAPTTVNTAIISGIVPTAPVGGDGSYSGGAENFPRFLENWGSKPLSFYGSMIELYKSNQSVGTWGKDNVYSPPAREWFFDTNFKMKPPPGSIMVYSYVKGKWSIL